jgi:hypothetical protein
MGTAQQTTQHYLKDVGKPQPEFIIIIIIISGMRLRSLNTAATVWTIVPVPMMDDGDCGAIDGMKIGRGNRSACREPVQAPLCPPQIPHDQTQATTVGRQ